MCKQVVELREVLLSNKPEAMIEASPKATVPVMCLPDGTVLEQSLEIMRWAMKQSEDPARLLSPDCHPQQQLALITRNDSEFKHWLDRYKYHVRFPEYPLEHYRAQAVTFIACLEERLQDSPCLFGLRSQLADVAIMPFVRQFSLVDHDWFVANTSVELNRWLNSWLESALFKAAMTKYPPWQSPQAPVYFQPTE